MNTQPEDIAFSVTIEVPERIVMEKRPTPVVVKFATKEEKDDYVLHEYLATVDELVGVRSAWTNQQISEAWKKLFHARKNFSISRNKNNRPVEPEVA